ncbi:DUF2970 domain-containing protein [bacterium]|nr:DUF2970 domain-containing protein [bacterium]
MTENDPKPIPRKTPKKKGEGPSMREQILARKRAEAQASSAPEAPEAEAAPEKPAAKGSSRPKRSGSGRSSAKRSDSDGAEGEGRSKRTRRERPQKKKSPVPLIATGVILIAAVAAGVVFLGGGDDETPGETTGTDTVANAASAEGAGDGTAAPEAGGSAGDAAAGDGEAGAGSAAPEGEAGASSVAAAPEEPKKKPKPAASEPVDLTALEPFGKPDGVTSEQWTKLQEDAEMFFDVDAGAAGGRARRRLEEAGQPAWPAILNEMIKLDPGKPDDNEQGMLAQRALNAARGSQTSQAFDWRTPDDGVLSEKNLRYNRKLIKALYDSWAAVVVDPSHWGRIDKAEAAAEAKADTEKKIEDEFEFDPSDLEGLDG